MISPGHHLYVGADGCWRHAAPGDRFERILGPPELLAAVQRIAYGGAQRPIAGEDDAQLEEVLAAFVNRGFLSTPEPRRTDAAGTTHVTGTAQVIGTAHVTGDNPIAARVVDLLSASRIGLASVDAADVVVSCVGWLPDSEWCELSDRVRETNQAWHMAYVDNDGVVIGPMYVPDLTASYRDVRGRRLAASSVPDELRAYWSYLEGDGPRPPVPWPDPAGAAIVAGFIARDVVAHVRGETLPALGVQLLVDPAHASVSRHPVLALPCGS